MTAIDRDKLADAYARALKHSPYLAMLAGRFPDRVEAILSGDLSDAQPIIDPDLPVRKSLRQAKAKQALTLAIADLAGVLALEQITAALSDFADVALDHAVAYAIESYLPESTPQGFAIIALGKHGGQELNYSSDIDPIFLFDPETLPCRPRDEPVEAAVRIGRHVLETMQSRDEDGYVFRTDLRLRPSPEVTPIALPVDAAISYYESQALPWERAAFIKARACAGDIELGAGFLQAIQPFLWRRGLDFGAITEIRDISKRIKSHHSRGQLFGPGYDIKLGRGGIRDIEFFTQIQQLIFGGRSTGLRSRNTQKALRALAEAGRLDPAEAATLTNAYHLYRAVEHRLQMVDDQQTHMLPKDAASLDAVAKLHGLEDGDAFLRLMEPYVEQVARLADGLDGEDSDQVPEKSALIASLSELDFVDVEHAAQRVEHWRSGQIRAIRTPAARSAFEAVLPTLLHGLGSAPDPNHAINQFSHLIERLPSAVNLFRLLQAQPQLLKLLLTIICEAPTLAEQLARRVDLLDILIDATALEPIADVEELAKRFASNGDLQDQLDHVRREVGEQRFTLGVQVVVGARDPLNAAKDYAAIAEAAIRAVAKAVIAEFEAVHGKIPNSELVILALGRLGGSELTHASDLDLIFLFTGSFDAESDGAKPLGASHYYNRLVQRVVGGLSVPTAAGPLYEVDTRLRPSGAKGPLAVTMESFAQYQREEAWTWEHMALTRARVVFGSTGTTAAVDAAIDQILHMPRDQTKTIRDAAQMREDMAQHKPPKTDLDVKLLPGGLVDMEFSIHLLQLNQAKAFAPDLADASAQLIGAKLAPALLGEAHRFMTRLLITLRLVAPDGETPQPSQQQLIAYACGCPNWQDVLSTLLRHRDFVSGFWRALTIGKED